MATITENKGKRIVNAKITIDISVDLDEDVKRVTGGTSDKHIQMYFEQYQEELAGSNDGGEYLLAGDLKIL